MRRQASRVVLVCAFVVSCDGGSDRLAAGQSRHWVVSSGQIRERVVGLLNLPEVVGDGCGQADAKRVVLYSAPSTSSPPIGAITLLVTDRQADGRGCGSAQLTVQRVDGNAGEELPTEESGYEIQAVVVHQRSGLWFRVALPQGSAWVLRSSDADFEPFPELLVHKLAYLRKGWDGSWWQTPGAGSATRVAAGWTRYLEDDIPVDVLDVRLVQNHAWLHVLLKTESCGESLSGVTPATVWIPAYQPSGAPSVWFYARGC
jgi:hypothetical protein